MKTIIIAAIARNGVIGRTTETCYMCMGRGRVTPEGPGTKGAFVYCVYCGECRGSGRVPRNDIPWSYPEDVRHFRDVTMGHAVVMGRKTWESIPDRFRPLQGRANVVVSRHMFDEPNTSLYVAGSLEGALAMARDYEEDRCYIVGGAQLYAAALPLADELDLTLIDRDYEGDVLFPTRHLDLYAVPSIGWDREDVDQAIFDCVERRRDETHELIFTKWVRR